MRLLLVLLATILALPATAGAQDTFSIVAVDTATGEVGSAGASCLGLDVAMISDVHPGAGAINTQALYLPENQSFGYLMMADGHTPEEIIDSLVANDAAGRPQIRQYGVASLAGGGSAASFTGTECIDYKGHITGATYSIQGNILLGRHILDSMEARFLRTSGSLADKLMAALQGANVSGADTRCAQYGTSSLSAFLRVAKPGDLEDQLWLDLRATIPNGSKEPVDSLQTLYNAWKLGSVEHPDTREGMRLDIHPNPLTAEATLRYHLPASGTITLELFDLLGRRAATLVNSRRNAGPHEMKLDAAGLASGIYYCRLSDGTRVVTRRVTIDVPR